MMPWRSRITYNGVVLTLALPVRPWDAGMQGIGAGREESAAGVVAAWVTRWAHVVDVTLRFPESDWPAVRAWLMWAAGTGGAFTWHPDQSGAASYSVYLQAPTAADERIQPARTEEPSTLELTVTLRTANGAPFDLAYFGAE